jgi:uncharacterized repeat protein (TIGR01451 family)
MKVKLIILLLLFSSISYAQIVTIPDAYFKAKLLEASPSNQIAKNLAGVYFKIDANNDGEIQVSEATQVSYLLLGYSSISSLVGIQSFSNVSTLYFYYNPLSTLDVSGLENLQNLSCANNQLSALDVSGCTNLQNLHCDNNQILTLDVSGLTNLNFLECFSNYLTTLDVSGCTNLQNLNCNYNSLTTLDVSGFANLQDLACDGNQLTTLKVSDCVNLQYLHCGLNQLTTLDVSSCPNLNNYLNCSINQLTYLNLKNGSNESWDSLYFSNNPNLVYICTNESQLSDVQNKINEYGYTNCHVNTYCSFTPGGTFYTIQGVTTFDDENNSCDSNDLSIPNVRFTITDGTNSGSFIANNTGNYSIPVQAGTHTVMPTLENPTFFNVNPTSFQVNFPTTTSPYTQNFCISPNGIQNDLEVTLVPIDAARPGFDAHYKIIYKNKGNTQLSGNVNFTFDDAKMDFVDATTNPDIQTEGNLSWNFSNILPFETREVSLTLNINSPTETPAVNIGDIINYSATINPISGDAFPNDNSFVIYQTVVGSYDPNDKTCLEGTTLSSEKIGDYLHYLIRFENTGTYPAENVVVKDLIDTNVFDVATLQITDTSHACVTKITNPNQVEFIFENINLPYDDAINDGYVAFKIKTKSNLNVGAQLKNKADIFFDYNFPITTNEYMTTIQTFGIDEQLIPSIAIYPNPVNDILNLNTQEEVLKIEIYDVAGRLLQSQSITDNKADLTGLKAGNYLLKIFTPKGISINKVVKE